MTFFARIALTDNDREQFLEMLRTAAEEADEAGEDEVFEIAETAINLVENSTDHVNLPIAEFYVLVNALQSYDHPLAARFSQTISF